MKKPKLKKQNWGEIFVDMYLESPVWPLPKGSHPWPILQPTTRRWSHILACEHVFVPPDDLYTNQDVAVTLLTLCLRFDRYTQVILYHLEITFQSKTVTANSLIVVFPVSSGSLCPLRLPPWDRLSGGNQRNGKRQSNVQHVEEASLTF